METSPLIYRANQWTGFYIIGTSVMKEFNTKCETMKMKMRPSLVPAANFTVMPEVKNGELTFS